MKTWISRNDPSQITNCNINARICWATLHGLGEESLVSDMLLVCYDSVVKLRDIHDVSTMGDFTFDVCNLLSKNDKRLLKRLRVPQFNDVSMLTILKKPIEHTLYCAITTEILNEVYRGDPSWPSLSTSPGFGDRESSPSISNNQA